MVDKKTVPVRKYHRDNADIFMNGEPYEYCHRDYADEFIVETQKVKEHGN